MLIIFNKKTTTSKLNTNSKSTMFSQRKTDSYDLVGTNARNSGCSIASQRQNYYGQTLINNIEFEQFDAALSQHLDQVFVPVTNFLVRTSSISNDPAEYLVSSNNGYLRISHEEMIDFCAQDLSDSIFRNYDMPFDFRKSVLNSGVETEDNTETLTKCTTTSPKSQDDKLDKLLKDLDFIDQPLAPKRLRAKKSDKCLKLLTVTH
jgi:hypothetical protein